VTLEVHGERGAVQFTEEFDFTAMNEKFNKDEVWGSLGKGKQGPLMGDRTEDDPIHYNVEVNEAYVQDPPKARSKVSSIPCIIFVPKFIKLNLGSS